MTSGCCNVDSTSPRVPSHDTNIPVVRDVAYLTMEGPFHTTLPVCLSGSSLAFSQLWHCLDVWWVECVALPLFSLHIQNHTMMYFYFVYIWSLWLSIIRKPIQSGHLICGKRQFFDLRYRCKVRSSGIYHEMCLQKFPFVLKWVEWVNLLSA